jgi:hypothetical protein
LQVQPALIIWPVLASRMIHLIHRMADKFESGGQTDQLYPQAN